MANRTRPIRVSFWVNEEEKAMIDKKAKLAGMNRSTLFRGMLRHGFVLHVDYQPIIKISSLHASCMNSLHQIEHSEFAKEYITDTDIAQWKEPLNELFDSLKLLLNRLGEYSPNK